MPARCIFALFFNPFHIPPLSPVMTTCFSPIHIGTTPAECLRTVRHASARGSFRAEVMSRGRRTLLGWLLLFLFPTNLTFAQSRFSVRADEEGYLIEVSLGDVTVHPMADGSSVVSIEDFIHRLNLVGHPDFPIWNQILQLPDGVSPKIELLADETYKMALPAMLLHRVMKPHFKGEVQPSVGEQALPELISYQELGYLRRAHLARISLCPVECKGDSLLIHNHIKLRVGMGSNLWKTSLKDSQDPTTAYLLSMLHKGDGKDIFDNGMETLAAPLRMLIVSRPKYSQSLQPFVQWKRQQGLIVQELYLDTYKSDSVKAALRRLYDNATHDNPFPTFILIVGGINDIQHSPGQHNISGLATNRTDLYYAEYTGDCIPDALLGRWPVDDTDQLQSVIEKTIAYEQYRFEDDSYLNQVLLVAGNEAQSPAPIVTNGQVNYLAEAFAEKDSSFTIRTFYNPGMPEVDEAWSAGRRDSLLMALGMGASHVNYTGHAKNTGWRYPTVSLTDIEELPSSGNYSFFVNNCCSSNNYTGACFGGTLLSKSNGGAIGVIGSTNETLWEEDYYWSVGAKPIVLQPLYDTSFLGVYDRWLHRRGEPTALQVFTAGQMLLSGGVSVAASASPYSDFYWEVYHLFGDPSLIPYLGQQQDQQPLVASPLSTTTARLTLQGSPHAYVAMSENGELLGVCQLDRDGLGDMELSRSPNDSVALLTSTLPGYKTQIDTLVVQGYQPPVSVESVSSQHISLYPNPARDMVTIDLGGCSEPVVIEIYDMQGRLLERFSNNSQSVVQYSTHSLRFNMCFVVVRNSETFSSHRLIIQK